jgi:hypothetical protein
MLVAALAAVVDIAIPAHHGDSYRQQAGCSKPSDATQAGLYGHMWRRRIELFCGHTPESV